MSSDPVETEWRDADVCVAGEVPRSPFEEGWVELPRKDGRATEVAPPASEVNPAFIGEDGFARASPGCERSTGSALGCGTFHPRVMAVRSVR